LGIAKIQKKNEISDFLEQVPKPCRACALENSKAVALAIALLWSFQSGVYTALETWKSDRYHFYVKKNLYLCRKLRLSE
jgi:hypothetical protein